MMSRKVKKLMIDHSYDTSVVFKFDKLTETHEDPWNLIRSTTWTLTDESIDRFAFEGPCLWKSYKKCYGECFIKKTENLYKKGGYTLTNWWVSTPVGNDGHPNFRDSRSMDYHHPVGYNFDNAKHQMKCILIDDRRMDIWKFEIEEDHRKYEILRDDENDLGFF